MTDTGLNALLARHHHDSTRLVQVLREAQEAEGWLSPQTLQAIADGLKLPLARVQGTATFYSFLYTRPVGEYRVLWSDNISDRMLGSAELMQSMCKALWLEPGKVSEDGLVSVDATSCTGLCDQGPALLVNGRPITAMTEERVQQIVALIRGRVPLDQWPGEFFAIHNNIRLRGPLLDHCLAPGSALGAALARGAPERMLAEIKTSGLRGRGGAGFSTALKWEGCRNAPGDIRYVVCNADEGEPGTFKDRVLLTECADLVFEGMTVAGYAVGARHGLLYLRGEYRYMLETLEAVLTQRRAAGLLGKAILGQPGFDFDIEIHLGAGAYICGEESALIESLEGKPGRPRNRPPFPVTHGYLGKPTAVNNVETLAAAALIAAKGGDWYRSLGTEKSAGSKLLSVAGDCARPGIYEYPYGVTVDQVLADCGAADTQAVQVSGPSGQCLAPNEFKRRIAFEDLPTAGAFTIFNGSRDLFETARNYIHFFAHESCGFCTPCRVGTSIAAKLMDKIAAGHGSPYDVDEIFKLHRVMTTASHCGLGHTACNPLFDTLKKFRPAYEKHLKSLDYEPAFDLDHALSQARQMTGRNDAAAHLSNEETAP